MDEGNTLTDRDFERVGRVVSRVEHQLFGDPPGGWDRDGAPTTHSLKVIAGAANSFGYPARVQQWDDATGDFTDYDTTEVRVKDPAGRVFVEGQVLPECRLLGANTSGVACFAAGPPERVEIVRPNNSGVAPPSPKLFDGQVDYLNPTTLDFDPGELCWYRDANNPA